MTKKFSLIKTLNESPKEVKKDPFPKGIAYQEYTIEVKGKPQQIFIPLKECAIFEEHVTHINKTLDEDDLRDLLRKHRGIKTNKG